jgi:glutamyl-tRNA reductase
VAAAEREVLEAVTEFEANLAARRLDPAVVALRDHVTGTVQREMERLLTRVPPEIAPELQRAAHRMTRSLLHTPTIRARMLARSGDGSDYLRALHTLFGIDVVGLPDGDGPAGDTRT